MMGERAKLSGDEVDAFGRMRRLLCWTRRPGARKKIKRWFHRKQRRRAHVEIRKGALEDG